MKLDAGVGSALLAGILFYLGSGIGLGA